MYIYVLTQNTLKIFFTQNFLHSKYSQNILHSKYSLHSLADSGARAIASILNMYIYSYSKCSQNILHSKYSLHSLADSGARAIASILKFNYSIRDVNAAGNGVGTKGAGVLLKVKILCFAAKYSLRRGHQGRGCPAQGKDFMLCGKIFFTA